MDILSTSLFCNPSRAGEEKTIGRRPSGDNGIGWVIQLQIAVRWPPLRMRLWALHALICGGAHARDRGIPVPSPITPARGVRNLRVVRHAPAPSRPPRYFNPVTQHGLMGDAAPNHGRMTLHQAFSRRFGRPGYQSRRCSCGWTPTRSYRARARRRCFTGRLSR